MAKTHSVSEKMRLLEPTVQIWMKIDSYYWWQKCTPVILESGNIRFMGIFAGVPLGGGVKWEWVWRRRQFGDLSGYFFWIFRDKASNIIWWHATPRPVTDCNMNDLKWLFYVKIRFRPALCWRIDASFGAQCTNLNGDRPILSAAHM